MKKHGYLWIFALASLVLVLFGAVWKASAPVRLKRQFESQANAQLEQLVHRGTITFYKPGVKRNDRPNRKNTFAMPYKVPFESLNVISVKYQWKSGTYDIWHWIKWKSKTPNQIIKWETKCVLKKVDDLFTGSCPATEPRRPMFIQHFQVAVRE